MSRIARIVILNTPHHITQTGNYGQDIFFNDNDRLYYLKLIKYYSKKYKLDILAYCLMDNHVHFVVVPKKLDSISKTFRDVHANYTLAFNKKRKIKGRLWQSRFFSSAMDERHALIAIRYVEQSPVRAKITERPWNWVWSSARFHIGEKDSAKIIRKTKLTKNSKKWKKELEYKDEKAVLDKLMWCLKSGRPFMDYARLKRIEKKMNMKLRMRRVGRPLVLG